MRNMKKRFGLALILAAILGMFSHASALSPPEWRAYNQLIYSIGLDDRVQINEPVENSDSYTVKYLRHSRRLEIREPLKAVEKPRAT